MKDTFKMDPKIKNQAVAEIKKLMARYGLLPAHLAMNVGIQPIRLGEVLNGRRGVTANTDLRLAKFFELSEGHFINLQTKYDLALTKDEISAKLEEIKPISQTAIKKT